MEKYIGTKIIQAEPLTRGAYNERRGWTIPEDENPNDAGFFVTYPDGYVSWSPKDIFEKAYRKTDAAPFGLAIEAVKLGKRISRAGWNGKEQYVELASNIGYQTPDGKHVNPHHAAIGNKALVFVGTSGVQLGWLASQADMLAEDWIIKEAN